MIFEKILDVQTGYEVQLSKEAYDFIWELTDAVNGYALVDTGNKKMFCQLQFLDVWT